MQRNTQLGQSCLWAPTITHAVYLLPGLTDFDPSECTSTQRSYSIDYSAILTLNYVQICNQHYWPYSAMLPARGHQQVTGQGSTISCKQKLSKPGWFCKCRGWSTRWSIARLKVSQAIQISLSNFCIGLALTIRGVEHQHSHKLCERD